MKDLIIKNSEIEGSGVFANRDFRKGEIITLWNVKGSYTRDEIESFPIEKKKRASYLGNNRYGIVSEPACFVNHSCNPNTESKNSSDVAIRNIMTGEEITADYTDEEGTTFVTFNCNCGNQNCRGKIG